MSSIHHSLITALELKQILQAVIFGLIELECFVVSVVFLEFKSKIRFQHKIKPSRTPPTVNHNTIFFFGNEPQPCKLILEIGARCNLKGDLSRLLRMPGVVFSGCGTLYTRFVIFRCRFNFFPCATADCCLLRCALRGTGLYVSDVALAMVEGNFPNQKQPS